VALQLRKLKFTKPKHLNRNQ